ncbi:hypothetical protein FOCC_FOCC006438 [Frankliniella occidentalis]|nr:hypothetical protein FOCC_FOCC006438 [Frankliniella occidentalis]
MLVCRVVCRHWCELVGHPDLWRRRTVSDLLLRLPPPCCRKLVLSYGNLGRIGYLASTTACAATQLSITDLRVIDFHHAGDNFSSLGLAAIIVRQQASLGRLRKLSLSMTDQPEDHNILFDLYAVALGIEGLQELEFTDVEAGAWVETSWSAKELLLSSHPDWPVVQPSLQVLMINYVALPFEVVELLLRTHAPTLKKLNTGYVLSETNKLAGLVSSIPNLQELWCMPMEGLEQLLECHTLRSLRIVIPTYCKYPETLGKTLSSTRSLLNSATQLTHVAFDYRLCNEFEEEEWWGKDLVKSLGAALPSHVASLEFDCVHINAQTAVGVVSSNQRRE